jgi:hypothetical protein
MLLGMSLIFLVNAHCFVLPAMAEPSAGKCLILLGTELLAFEHWLKQKKNEMLVEDHRWWFQQLS